MEVRSIATYSLNPTVKTRYVGTDVQLKSGMNVAASYPHTAPFGLNTYNLVNSNPTTGLGLFPGTAKSLEGVVTDQNGSPLSRKVIAISERTYLILGSATSDGSGNFSLKLLTSNEDKVMLVAVPNTGEARNAVVFHSVVPV